MPGRLKCLPEGFVDIWRLPFGSGSRPCCSDSVRTANRRSYSTTLASQCDKYEPTIGLELHVQLKTHVKLFSNAHTSYEAVPNTHVQPFDAGLPGALPVLNSEPVGLALRAALALGCQVHRRSKFDRKHYFYPDLPPGFQITQKYSPLATGGKLTLTPRHDGLQHSHTVGVTQIQLEQDTAKSIHDTYSGQTLLDLNRAGTPLIEIISDPDMHSTEQAAAYVRKVQGILRSIGSSDADMEKGSMRIDVNISVAPLGSSTPGTRCEIKNLNSVRSMIDAITHEVERQSALLEAGHHVEQQTRGFDAVAGTTSKLRSKSDAPDYRYMPDPELAPMIIPEAIIHAVRQALPLLHDQIRDKLEQDYDLSAREIDILVRMSDQPTGAGMSGLEFFQSVAHGRKARTVANWILHDLLGQFTKRNESFETTSLTPQSLGLLIDAVEGNKFTSTYGKNILAAYFEPSNTLTLEEMVKTAIGETSQASIDYDVLSSTVLQALPAEAERVRKGNANVLARLIGEGMKRSGGRADAKALRKSLLAALQ